MNEEMNILTMKHDAERSHQQKFYNVDVDSAQEMQQENEALMREQQGLFIHPDDLKDWKKFQAKMKKDKQVQYSQTIRSKMMRIQQ